MTPFTLRPAEESDREVTYEITRDAMRDYVIKTWGEWKDDEQREKHRQNYIPVTHRIVLRNNSEVGLLAAEEEPTISGL